MIKITLYDRKEMKGYFQYIEEDEEVGVDRRLLVKDVKNNDYLCGFLECLAQSDECPYFIMMAKEENLDIELEHIIR